MIVHVGQPTLYGSLGQYVRHFDLLEVRAQAGRLPHLAQLKRWRKDVPRGFVFSVVVPIQTGGLDEASIGDASYGAAVADALRAQWLVLQTSAEVMPGRASRERLSTVVASLRGARRRLAWEHHGPWSAEQAERFAAELGAVLVGDAAESEPADGPVVYTRLRAFASGGRLRTSAIERAAERLAYCHEAVVVLEGRGGAHGARLLRELLADCRDEANVATLASGGCRADGDESRGHDEDALDDDADQQEEGAQ
ncbi:MAG: DUF72 domain-containing protein [Polyangiaceae bacterium]|nr:DUF72 domain-containing protein [Polyangiaceae bacterium]